MNEKVVEVLETAKNILESEMDWCQHRLYKYDNGSKERVVAACAVGAFHLAISRVFTEGKFIGKAAHEAMECIHSNLPPGFDIIANFNDDENTTKEDVLLMYKRAIEEASQ